MPPMNHRRERRRVTTRRKEGRSAGNGSEGETEAAGAGLHPPGPPRVTGGRRLRVLPALALSPALAPAGLLLLLLLLLLQPPAPGLCRLRRPLEQGAARRGCGAAAGPPAHRQHVRGSSDVRPPRDTAPAGRVITAGPRPPPGLKGRSGAAR